MSNPTVIVRHLEDQNDLLNYGSDNLLMPGQEDLIVTIAEGIIGHARSLGVEAVDIVTSAKIRAYSTGKEVREALQSSSNDLPITLHGDARMNELGQGSFVLPDNYRPNDHFEPLMKAWDAYFHEVFVEQNIEYHFGDPILNEGIAKYPCIIGAFSRFGESHREFSIRFYEFILDHIGINCGNGVTRLPVVITHQAIASRIHQLKHLAELDHDYVRKHYSPGKLVFLEWGSREKIRSVTNTFKRPGGFYLSDLSSLYGFQDIIYTELESLKNGEI